MFESQYNDEMEAEVRRLEAKITPLPPIILTTAGDDQQNLREELP